MTSYSLLGEGWKLNEAGSSVTYDAAAPCSVLSVLLEEGVIPDPYDRENEKAALRYLEKDYEFSRSFTLGGEQLLEDACELVFEGLDTVTDIFLNGEKLSTTKNMHRTYRFPVKDRLKMGANEIRIFFHSPLKFISEHTPVHKINYCAAGALPGGQYMRKAHSSFGWDWGPQLPDMGILRDIRIESFSKVRLKEVHFYQEHENGGVTLFIDPILEYTDPIPVEISIDMTGQESLTMMTRMLPDGVSVTQRGENEVGIKVKNPKLWWPNGCGEDRQPLYEVKLTVKKADKIYDSRTYRVGLRTIELVREKDEYGESFCFAVNGLKIFAKGADYIPEDALYPRINAKRQAELLDAAKDAGFNCLRIWGGGYYPTDEFYDMCDSRGILLWQDLMFACNVYELTPGFEKSILAEVRDNVKRLKHHACLALWCGNNEIESAWYHWPGFKDEAPALKADYIKMFEYLLPAVVADEDEQTPWWPSSPSSGGCFDAPDDENRGDAHYWDVWHGEKPFTEYRQHHFRFLSEFGFQSFPSIKTVKSFTEPEDRNIFSPVMESHQKNEAANGKMLRYISGYFRYPKDLEQLIYTSQILQGLAIEYGVDHFRRERGRCMGTLFWQLNDNWPVASWSAIDWYGRRKPLMYMAKRFFAKQRLSGTLDGMNVTPYVVNDGNTDETLRVKISLMTLDGSELARFSEEGRCPAGSVWKGISRSLEKPIEGRDPRELYINIEGDTREGKLDSCQLFLVPFKYLDLKRPGIETEVLEEKDHYVIKLKSDIPAPFVVLDLKDADAVFSDNVLFLQKDREVSVKLDKKSISGMAEIADAKTLREQLVVYDLRGAYE
ncbi:MAG: glycoside hydrolase family 2 protein [Lachnospiraceae bacterium]|nr:glycoside hydrolase family 2 protein [Lachnospiraceae bacterium]